MTAPYDETENVSGSNFLSKLGAPARNALLNEHIDTFEKLATYSEKEILKLHGVGPFSLPVLRNALQEKGLSFKK